MPVDRGAEKLKQSGRCIGHNSHAPSGRGRCQWKLPNAAFPLDLPLLPHRATGPPVARTHTPGACAASLAGTVESPRLARGKGAVKHSRPLRQSAEGCISTWRAKDAAHLPTPCFTTGFRGLSAHTSVVSTAPSFRPCYAVDVVGYWCITSWLYTWRIATA